ncbi:unnamed protein product [Prorocentrum cordatum]|uniref:Uncharacterized protein n=1 Tax=Prorocentrum cordatum TaxID=2364126 RepID=A0ABN9U8H2_9DINO|nr:unnamed protein product [Polarella glacialis]
MNDRLARFLAEHDDFELCDDGQKVRWKLASGGTGKKFAASNYGALESFVQGSTYKERTEQREAVSVPLSISLEGEASACVEERLEDVRRQLHVQEQISRQTGKDYSSLSSALHASKRQLPHEQFSQLVDVNRRANHAKHVGLSGRHEDAGGHPPAVAQPATSGGGATALSELEAAVLVPVPGEDWHSEGSEEAEGEPEAPGAPSGAWPWPALGAPSGQGSEGAGSEAGARRGAGGAEAAAAGAPALPGAAPREAAGPCPLEPPLGDGQAAQGSWSSCSARRFFQGLAGASGGGGSRGASARGPSGGGAPGRPHGSLAAAPPGSHGDSARPGGGASGPSGDGALARRLASAPPAAASAGCQRGNASLKSGVSL